MDRDGGKQHAYLIDDRLGRDSPGRFKWRSTTTSTTRRKSGSSASTSPSCRNDAMMRRVASAFPSAEMLDSWIHIFLASHLCQVSSWIHYGSFTLNSQWPDWLAITASAGAAVTPVPTLRRFGFALACRTCRQQQSLDVLNVDKYLVGRRAM